MLPAPIAFPVLVVPTPLEATSDVALPALAHRLLMEAALLVKRLNAQVVHGRVKLLRALPVVVVEEEDLQPVLLALHGLHQVLLLVLLAQLALALIVSSLQLALLPLIQSVAATLVQQRTQQVQAVFQQPWWSCPTPFRRLIFAQQRALLNLS